MLKLLLVISLFSASVYASIGTITGSIGDVYIIRDMKSQKVKKGDSVLTKDLLFSRSKSKVQVTFIDETVISIGQKSSFLIEDYAFVPDDPKASRCSFKFSKGSARSVSGKIGKIAKENFKLKTKNANISIKGTITMLNQTVNAQGENVTTNVTTEGATTISTEGGGTQFVAAGQVSNAIGNNQPTLPSFASSALIQSFSIATDPTTSQTPNLNIFSLSSLSKIVLNSNIKKQAKTNTSILVNTEKSSEDIKSMNLQTPKVNFQNSIENLKFPIDIDNENQWGKWENVVIDNSMDKDIQDAISDNEVELKTIVQGYIEDDLDETIFKFSGKVTGILRYKSNLEKISEIKQDSHNNIDMTITLGRDKGGFTSEIDFYTTSDERWDLNYKGDATSTGLSGDIISTNSNIYIPDILCPHCPEIQSPPIDIGNIQGKYNGITNITGVEGTFSAAEELVEVVGSYDVNEVNLP